LTPLEKKCKAQMMDCRPAAIHQKWLQPPNPTQTAVISKRDGISLKFCSHRWNSTSFLLIKELLQIEILHISDVLNLVASAFYF
jgi:hypothetical protein